MKCSHIWCLERSGLGEWNPGEEESPLVIVHVSLMCAWGTAVYRPHLLPPKESTVAVPVDIARFLDCRARD